MKIRLAIIETDDAYLKRITAAFNTKYSDKIEVYSFTSDHVQPETLGSVDVVLAHEGYDVEALHLSQRQAFAYLTDRPGVDQIDGRPAICRFQKAEAVYKQILNLYAEIASDIVGQRTNNGDPTKVLCFTSPCGGTGTSTLAAACAIHFAATGKRTLYLNLETFGTADMFFSKAGQYGMSDIVLALKSRRANLQMKLEGCVRQDDSGVFFYSAPMLALDMMELEHEEMLQLLTELRLSGQYDCIVVDMDFVLSREVVHLYQQMSDVVWVSDATALANEKIKRAYECVRTIDKIDKRSAVDEILLLYNKMNGEPSRGNQINGLRCIGAIARYKGADARQIAFAAASSVVFDQI